MNSVHSQSAHSNGHPAQSAAIQASHQANLANLQQHMLQGVPLRPVQTNANPPIGTVLVHAHQANMAHIHTGVQNNLCVTGFSEAQNEPVPANPPDEPVGPAEPAVPASDPVQDTIDDVTGGGSASRPSNLDDCVNGCKESFPEEVAPTSTDPQDVIDEIEEEFVEEEVPDENAPVNINPDEVEFEEEIIEEEIIEEVIEDELVTVDESEGTGGANAGPSDPAPGCAGSTVTPAEAVPPACAPDTACTSAATAGDCAGSYQNISSCDGRDIPSSIGGGGGGGGGGCGCGNGNGDSSYMQEHNGWQGMDSTGIPSSSCMERCKTFQRHMRSTGCGGTVVCRKRCDSGHGYGYNRPEQVYSRPSQVYDNRPFHSKKRGRYY